MLTRRGSLGRTLRRLLGRIAALRGRTVVLRRRALRRTLRRLLRWVTALLRSAVVLTGRRPTVLAWLTGLTRLTRLARLVGLTRAERRPLIVLGHRDTPRREGTR